MTQTHLWTSQTILTRETTVTRRSLREKKKTVRFTQMHSGVLHHTLDPSRFPIGVIKHRGTK